MKRLLLALIFSLPISYISMAQEEVSLIRDGGTLFGTLLMPENVVKPPIVLIIAGSGPTDRNGNSSLNLKTDAYKLMAEGLQREGIASFRFDKRMIGASRWEEPDEEKLLFEDYIDDVKALAEMLYDDERFSEVVLAGHSEGSLIAMAVAQDNHQIAKVISIAGAGRPIDIAIKEQLAAQPLPSDMHAEIDRIFESLKRGERVDEMTPTLMNLFRPSVQPYMISWMKYVPSELISRLTQPVMVIQGGTDVQAKEIDYNELISAQPTATRLFIPDMSHVLKKATSSNLAEQIMTVYTNPDLPLHEELLPAMIKFINSR